MHKDDLDGYYFKDGGGLVKNDAVVKIETLVEKLGPISYRNPLAHSVITHIQIGNISVDDGIVLLIEALVGQNDALLKKMTEAFWKSSPQLPGIPG